MRTIRTWLCVPVAAAVIASASAASAYCLTTTCDPNVEDCAEDADGCATQGLKLSWPVACTSYNLGMESSPNISFEAFTEAAAVSFGAWTSLDCGSGQRPSIQVSDLGAVASPVTCYNQRNGNSNVVFFQSKSWPYAGSKETLALTTVTFNTQTGEIYDADLEVNSAEATITVGDVNVEYDLQSIITHEAGHYFGLAHASSANKTSTMYPTYAKKSTALRTLEADDAAGMCALYPPDRKVGACDSTPRHGFGTTCGDPPADDGGCCNSSVAPARPRGTGPLALLSMIGIWAAWRSRRLA